MFMPKHDRTRCWAAKIGAKIRARRKAMGLSLEEFSRLSGVTVSTLSHIERGKRDVKLSTLVSLTLALRIDLPDLFEDEVADNKSQAAIMGADGYDLDDD